MQAEERKRSNRITVQLSSNKDIAKVNARNGSNESRSALALGIMYPRALDHRRWGISTPSFTRSLLYLRVHACARSCTMHMRDQSSKQCLTGVWRVFPHAVHLWAPISYRKLSTIFLATDEDVLMETPRPSETSCSSTGPVKLRRFGIMIPVCLPITDDLYHLRHMLYIYS